MSDSRLQQLIDEPALVQWLDSEGIEPDLPISVRRITAGHSNEVFKVTRGGLQLALRRPPRSLNTKHAHDMSREFRVMRALWEQSDGVPVPRPFALCEDLAVMGVPFFVMDFVDGAIVRDHRVPEGLAGDPSAPRRMSELLLDNLVAIHAFDWERAGLDDLGRPEGFLERQTGRWMSQLDRCRTRSLTDLDDVGAWLSTHIPAPHPPTLIHWDYRLDNVVYTKSLPVKVLAILDWEVATIGEPLIDLGWLLAFWRDPREDWPIDESIMGQFPAGTDFPTRTEMTERYARLSGRDTTHIKFFIAMGLFKMACLLEGVYAKHLRGESDDARFASLMEDFVPELAARAKHILL